MPHSPGDEARTADAGRGEAPLLRLAVPNELAAVEATRVQVLAFLAGRAVSARLIHRLELVLEEGLMNRLAHAFPDAGLHHTDLSVQFAAKASACAPAGGTASAQAATIVLCFEDDGIPFDPLQMPLQTASAPSRDPSGGFGLMLTRKAASSCRYERLGGRNRFTVWLVER